MITFLYFVTVFPLGALLLYLFARYDNKHVNSVPIEIIPLDLFLSKKATDLHEN